MKLYDTQAKLQERALLVGLEQSGQDRWAVQDSLDELSELARTAGAEVVDYLTQRRDAPSAPTFIGRGKARELAALCQERAVNTVIFDDDLSPAQGRNLGDLLGNKIKVLDRTQLILDIFAQRARTREGKIQVELAQLQYMLPRLTGLWTHLSRQRGGVGTRGPGEQQLEVDRRRIQEKIGRLRRQLGEVQKNRRVERSGRQRTHWPLASLVGYTNSGKSTLMRALSGAAVLAEDKLFATLDPTTRRVDVGPPAHTILLSDTVGFLRKLPHHLVESFKATLEEVVEAELLVHVVDVSHPQVNEQLAAVEVVLDEIHASGKPTVIALNKIDRLSNSSGTLDRYCNKFPHAVPISARQGDNLDALRQEIANTLRDRRVAVRLAIPHSESALIARVYRGGSVIARSMEDGCVILDAQLPPRLLAQLEPYCVEKEP